MDAMTMVVIVIVVIFTVGGLVLNRASDKASKKFDEKNKK